MRRLLTSCVSALGALALAASAAAAPFDVLDFDQDSIDMNGPSVVAPSPGGRHVYVCASLSGTLVGYAVDDATGALTRIDLEVDDDELLDGLGGCPDIAIAPDGRFLYVAGRFDDALALFARDPDTGQLTYLDVFGTEELPEGQRDGLLAPVSVELSPDGRFLYVAAFSSDVITVFSRNSTNGLLALVEIERNAPGGYLDGPNSLAMSHDGAYLYATTEGQLPGGGFADSLLTFARDAATGEITLVDTDRNGAAVSFALTLPNAVVASRDGLDVYAAASDSEAIAWFARVPGADPTQFSAFVNSGMPGLDGLTDPVSLAITADGAYLLATAVTTNSLLVLTRDPATGALTHERTIADAPATRLLGATDVAIDPLRRFVYVVAYADDALTVFAPEPGDAGLGAAIAALALRCLVRRSRRS